eukprot:886710-Pyramimonas_sp.AAC.1
MAKQRIHAHRPETARQGAASQRAAGELARRSEWPTPGPRDGNRSIIGCFSDTKNTERHAVMGQGKLQPAAVQARKRCLTVEREE